MYSILAGFFISIAAAIFLTVQGPLGAFMFSLGLLTILFFKLELFTGKAGLISTKNIKIGKLLRIWCGNFIGSIMGVFLLSITNISDKIVEPANVILNARLSNSWFENIILGFFCGVLMYVAVQNYKTAPYVTILCVASFILLGANHCVADMSYLLIAATADNWIAALITLLCSTLGNFIGCNLIGWCRISPSNC